MTPAAVHLSTHASGLHSVERELAELHRRMLHRGQGDARTVRLCVLTLVAICADERGAQVAEETVEYLSKTHPARAIIVLANTEGDDRIEADLALICSPDPDGQICAEQVRLGVSGTPARHLASAITPLLVPDIPVYVWLLGAPALERAFHHEAATLQARLILDSDAYQDARLTLATLSAEMQNHPEVIIADMAWARGRRWREHIAQAFDGMNVRPFIRHITRVEVECGGTEPSALARLTGGWLLSRLTRDGREGPQVVVTATPTSDVPPGSLWAVRLFGANHAHRATITVVCPDSNIHTRIHIDGGLSSSRAVPFQPPDHMKLIGSLLEDAPEDPIYRDAVRCAETLAGGAGVPSTLGAP